MMPAERHICAYCYYFRSAIIEKDVPDEQDWGLCAIRSSRTAGAFSPEAQKLQKTNAKVEENQVEGTFSCKYFTKKVDTNL